MKKSIGIWGGCLLGLLACSEEQTVPEFTLEGPEKTTYEVGQTAQRLALPVRTNGSWTADTEADWLVLNRLDEASCDSLIVEVKPNAYPEKRRASVEVRLIEGEQCFQVQVMQDGASRLLGLPGYEKGAGYSYDVTAEYTRGMRYQVFDVKYMDYRQLLDGKDYVVDDTNLTVEEEFVQGKTEEEISRQISAKASIGLDVVKVFQAGLTGSVDYTELEAKSTQFAMQRTKRVVYTRDIQYANVLAGVLAGDYQLLAPGFYEDWYRLQQMNQDGVESREVTRFLQKWGPCFVSRSCLGGCIDYEMEIDESVLSQSLSIELALKASLAGVINADGGGGYKEAMEKMKGRYRKYVHVRGGDAQQISILHTGGSIRQEDFQKWLKSITYQPGQTVNVALIDVKLVSFAELFTGQVRQEMKKQINRWNEIFNPKIE